LRELRQEKTLIYLTCFIVTRLQIANDCLAQAFLVNYKTFYDQGASYKADKVPEILDLFTDNLIEDDTSFGIIRARAFKIILKNNFR